MASWPDDTLALFRYSLIAPLLDPLADPEEKRRWRAEVVSRPHLLPDGRRVRVSAPTLRRWVHRYRLGGFEALRPAMRRDRGSVRVVTPELLEQAKALKRQDPARSLPQVIRLLEAAGLVAPQTLKPNTLWRHLHREGLSRRVFPPKPGLRRFEAKAPNDLWQGDATPGPALPDPFQPGRMRRTYLSAFLNDASRLVAPVQSDPARPALAPPTPPNGGETSQSAVYTLPGPTPGTGSCQQCDTGSKRDIACEKEVLEVTSNTTASPPS